MEQVRGHRLSELFRHRRRAAPARDARAALQIGHEDIGRARHEQVAHPARVVVRLPGADGDVAGLRDLSTPPDVFMIDRFLHPVEAEGLERPARAYRGFHVPGLVGVHHERDLIAYRLAHGADSLDVVIHLPSHAELHGPESARLERSGFFYEFVYREIQPESFARIAGNLALLTAQVFP